MASFPFAVGYKRIFIDIYMKAHFKPYKLFLISASHGPHEDVLLRLFQEIFVDDWFLELKEHVLDCEIKIPTLGFALIFTLYISSSGFQYLS